MNTEVQLKLQAWLDGELSAAEVKVVERLLQSDSQAAALLAELRNTRTALGEFDHDVKLPESREFYWSKIRREINRLENREAAAAVAAAPVAGIQWLRRILVPAAAVCTVALAAWFVTMRVSPAPGNAIALPSELAFVDQGAFTYRDYESGTTFVWLSYPSENEFAGQNSGDIIN